MKVIWLLMILAASCMAATRDFDVVVYGGTAGGVIAAVSAAREGLKTALVEPTNHLGGMVSGGLGWTDYGKKEVIGGYALEFYYRVGLHYGMNRFGNEVSWLHEPHVAEDIFRQMLKEAGVTVLTGQRLREKSGVRKERLAVREITMEDGSSFTAKIFMDTTYEGDLMAQTGITFTFGRESSQQYGESLGGVREKTPLHQFLVNVSPYDAQHHLLLEISDEKPGPAGSADKKVQAYNFRMCLSEIAGNQTPFVKPEGYDPKRYELLVRLIEARTKAEGKVPPLGSFMKIDRIPNGKSDVNNNGAFSTDYIGGSWDYPNATYAKRQQIWEAHKRYITGFLYFMANDTRVPAELRSDLNKWGLCKDEFTDTGNWPRQLYIREARRMVGEYVAVQKDLQTELTKPDPIGMGSYNSDSHNLERVVDTDGFVRNEGDMQVAVKPYQIPYRSIVPKRGEVQNVLVPVCFSASHVAYSSMRMEPQYMIIGQAAGVAAKMAIAGKKSVQEIDTAALTAKLRSQGAVLEYMPTPQGTAIQNATKIVK
jgi:FAD dependent oxidoreductase